MKKIQRTYIPGSQWCYFKIYTGIKTADKILIEYIPTIINTLTKKNIIEKWFFIRYEDPDFHLRIRILLKNESYIREVIRQFYKKLDKLVEEGYIWKIQLDSYVKELERYSAGLIEESESIFFHDSECIIQTMKMLKKMDLQNERWLISMKMIDSFLNNCPYGLEWNYKIITNLSNEFKLKYGFNKYNSKQFNIKYRERKREVENILDDKNEIMRMLSKPINKKSKNIIPFLEKINNKSSIEIFENIISSHIHMTLNRVFQSKSNIYELVIYEFMSRYYKSKIAQNKLLNEA